jgi:hypothetical protein
MTSHLPGNLADRVRPGRGVRAGSLVAGMTLTVALAASIGGCSHHLAASGSGNGIAVLSCRDSAGQQPADPQARPVNGVESFALNGDPNANDTLPAWKSTDGHRYLIWKTFLAIASRAGPYRVVTVASPATARLFYASPKRWGQASSSQVIAPPPRRIRLPVCGGQYTGYTGGILIIHPGCVTLTVIGPGGKPASVTVPILVNRCRATKDGG